MLESVAILALLALIAPIGVRVLGSRASIPIAAVSLSLAGWFATRIPTLLDRGTISQNFEWVPSLGVNLSFTLDGLSAMFAVLICGIGGLVLLYTGSYLMDSPGLGRFYTTLIAFMTAMLGLVLADNMLVMFVFWELTSITSFLLIGFDFHRPNARRCAWQSLIVTGLGGLALLAGVILLAIASGGPASPEFSLAALDRDSIQSSSLLTPAIILILVGCFSKSAIVPFHFWLPNAMEAPSPVSALLHSSTMVKAGVYLIARLHPTLSGHELWEPVLTTFGTATMLLGAFLASRSIEFKKILAYSTVSSLGILVMLIGLGAYYAAATYLIAHALFKACLFLLAGSAVHAAGTKNTEAVGHLGRHMPITRVSAILGGLSLAGVLPFLGFAGKELLLKATLGHSQLSLFLAAATGLAAVLTVFAAFQVCFKPFFMAATVSDVAEDAHPHECDWQQWIGPLLLGSLGLVFGLFPALGITPLVGLVGTSVSGSAIDEVLKLKLTDLVWPITPALLISIGAVLFGGLLFLRRHQYRSVVAASKAVDRVGPERTYDGSIAATMRFANILTQLLQNGSLRIYVRTVVLTTTALVALSILRLDSVAELLPEFSALTVLDAMLVLTIVTSAVSATLIRSRLGAIAALSGIGFALAIYFILQGAPDVSGTQFAVETLIVVLFVLVTHRLPRFAQYTRTLSRSIDIVIALGLGSVVTVLALIALGVAVPEPISAYQAANSVTQAYGRNVVNVILVDYRAIDTLGEIFVLAVASIGVYTLLTMRPYRAPEGSK